MEKKKLTMALLKVYFHAFLSSYPLLALHCPFCCEIAPLRKLMNVDRQTDR